ncbi:MAG: DUF5665 domain-containing protein [Candidatus Paceibacterota bacterium]
MEDKEQIEELNENLEILSHEIEETNSPKRSFVRGIFLGVGTTVGTTIVAALLIAIILWLLKTFQNVPFIGDILEWLNIEKYIS